ncbi:MAG TPA: hypothetical protein VF384_07235 [Planctomycetota bacterium]
MTRENARRQLVVDRKWQTRVWGITTGAALAAGFGYMLVAVVAATWMPIEEMSGGEVGTLAVLLNTAFFALLAGVLWYATVRITQRVAGPARLLTQALVGLRNGEYHHRTTLRSGDYLQDLAAATSALTEHLQQRTARQRQLLLDIESALPAETSGRVREIVKEALAAQAPATTGAVPAANAGSVDALPSLADAMQTGKQEQLTAPGTR